MRIALDELFMHISNRYSNASFIVGNIVYPLYLIRILGEQVKLDEAPNIDPYFYYNIDKKLWVSASPNIETVLKYIDNNY